MIGATHGDEQIGVRALCALSARTSGFDWIIGNPPAYRDNTRCYEGDLNRSAPGDVNASMYATRRAAEILTKVRNYDWCIDIHGTTAYSGIFIIITKMSRENLRLAARLNIPRIVYWPSITPDLKGPLSEYIPCGLEIECGPKSMPIVEEKLTDILTQFVAERDDIRTDNDVQAFLQSRELYQVDGVCKTRMDDLEEFVPAVIDGKECYPLLVNQYVAQGVTCYTMSRKALSDWW